MKAVCGHRGSSAKDERDVVVRVVNHATADKMLGKILGQYAVLLIQRSPTVHELAEVRRESGRVDKLNPKLEPATKSADGAARQEAESVRAKRDDQFGWIGWHRTPGHARG